MSRASKSKSKNIKRLNESILNEACINAGNKCTAAISCGGDSNYHGTVSFSCSCNTPAGNFGSGWIDCGHSEGTGVGGDLPYELTGDKTRTEKKGGPVVIWPSKKDKLEEGCGCDGGKETSKDSYMAASQLHSISNKAEDMYNKLEKDEVLDDWVESHLAKIDQMMDSVSDSFNHDQYKHAGDMGPGGCPPGHHWCAASDSCRSDNKPQTEPMTLMGTDVVSLNEQASNARNIKKELRMLNEQANPNNCNNPQYICQNAVTSPGFPGIDACHMFKSNGLYDINDSCNINGGGHTIFSHNKTNSQWFSYLGNPSPGDKFKYVRQTPSGGGVVTAWNMEYEGIDPMGCVGSIPDPSGLPISCSSSSGTTSCDTTPSSPCAQQWFQNPNATWAANWINNRDCSNYNWPSINLEQQANTIMAGAPNQPTIPYTYNSWNDIWGAANSSGLVPPQKNQFIAKMAKAKFSQCQIQACNC